MVKVNVCISHKELEAGSIVNGDSLDISRLKFLLVNQIMNSFNIKGVKHIEQDIVVNAEIDMDTLFV